MYFKQIQLILIQVLELPSKNWKEEEGKKMSETLADDEGEEQLKIETVINHIKSEDHLNKDQLHEAFLSAGLEEVNETVRKVLRELTYLY